MPCDMISPVILSGLSDCHRSRGAEANRTHIIIEIHEVGDDLDVGVVDSGLADDFLQHVTQASRKDEDRNIVLMQAVKELLVAFPDTKKTGGIPTLFIIMCN